MKELKLTPDAFLDIKVSDGNVRTLRDYFNEYVVMDGGLGYDDEDAKMRKIAENLIEAVLLDVAQAAEEFSGDASDFSEWLSNVIGSRK